MRAAGRIAAVISMALSLAGCGYAGLNDVALPGGPSLGRAPLHVTVDLVDTANLAEQSAVKVDDVTVGEVRSISIDGWNPRAQVVLAEGTALPANAVAVVRQTGLLGEKYLELAAPTDVAPQGRLTDGGTIAADHTSTSVEVEEVLGALSLLLNGGGLENLRTIAIELHKALGNSDEVRAFLAQLDGFTMTMANNQPALQQALDNLDRLSASLASGHQTIADAIETIQPALTVIADQRRQLDGLLKATTQLSDVGSKTVRATKDDLVANLESLQPILQKLNEAGDSVPRRLAFLLSFPFPADILTAIHGDYVNANIQIDASMTGLQQLLTANTASAGGSQ